MVAMRVLEARAERRESSSLSSRTKVQYEFKSHLGHQNNEAFLIYFGPTLIREMMFTDGMQNFYLTNMDLVNAERNCNTRL
jgi:hypothetical protein